MNVVLLAALMAFSLWGYTRLPEAIPVHFDHNGNVNGTGSRAVFLILPVIGLFSIGIMYVSVRLAARNPALINVPNKKKLMALPVEEQRWVIEPLINSMDWLSSLLILLFFAIEYSIYAAARGADVQGLLNGTLLFFIPCMLVFPLVMIVQIQRRLDEAVKRAAAAPGVVMR
jgi:uncharacterized membrane protein